MKLRRPINFQNIGYIEFESKAINSRCDYTQNSVLVLEIVPKSFS